jgi:hypothetical protein
VTLSETSQWHITMPVGGGIHAINEEALDTLEKVANLKKRRGYY